MARVEVDLQELGNINWENIRVNRKGDGQNSKITSTNL